MNKAEKNAMTNNSEDLTGVLYANDPLVFYFTKPDFNGEEEHWSATFPIDQIDGGGPSGDTTFLGHFGSLIVTHGQCETTTDAGGTFPGPDSSMSYYNANEGVNNQGCFPDLGGDTNRVRGLRTQNPEIYRPTNTPYLVLRTKGGPGDATAKILTQDTPSMNAFSTEMAFCIGSNTGCWYLYSEPNYSGDAKVLFVDEGYAQQGVYYIDPFIVRSARMSDGLGPQEKLPYNKDSLRNIKFINKDYPHIEKIRIRLEGTDDVWVDLDAGDVINFPVMNSSNGTRAMVTYNGHNVQAICFDNNDDSDDVFTPKDDFGGEWGYFIYHMNNLHDGLSIDETAIEFLNGYYLNYYKDLNGIAGDPAALFTQKLISNSDGTENIEITISLDK
uniref:hypothetical protein n=1 Tax=Klebsiella aerogenes TaxID=548 RepID=UPI002E3057CD|nr:hypothetical protein [Klebsiella aerogenes]